MILPSDLIASNYFFLLADRWLQFTFMWVKKPELLWLIIPVWLNWLITEYFQERKGTSYGNAVTNGFVMFWVGLDSTRTIVENYAQKAVSVSLASVVMVIMMLGYGTLVMHQAIQGKKTAHLLGRIREVTYLSTIAIGIINGVVVVDANTIIAMVVFFPVFYIGMEIFLRLLPAPLEERIEEIEEEKIPEQRRESPAQRHQSFQQRYKELLKRRLLFRRR